MNTGEISKQEQQRAMVQAALAAAGSASASASASSSAASSGLRRRSVQNGSPVRFDILSLSSEALDRMLAVRDKKAPTARIRCGFALDLVNEDLGLLKRAVETDAFLFIFAGTNPDLSAVYLKTLRLYLGLIQPENNTGEDGKPLPVIDPVNFAKCIYSLVFPEVHITADNEADWKEVVDTIAPHENIKEVRVGSGTERLLDKPSTE